MTAVRKSEPSETATLGATTNDAGTAAHTGVPNAESALHSCRRDTSGEPLTTSAEPPAARDPVTVLRFLASEARLDGDLTPGITPAWLPTTPGGTPDRPCVPLLGAVLSAAVAVVADVRNRGGVDRKTLSRWLRADQDLLAALDAAVEAAAPGAADELVRIWRSAR